ncbi:hypothetical protein MNBD_GAMMA16-667 [hydrothermal vent metagenome]|uniref:Uncharacterized protein n=1 Tax=hydrothermal vent metagenome TaxID=652676 RepID=A0A3B1A3I4_9ZZZZ
MSKADSFILVDAHVHIQDCFSFPQFFRCAYDNFKKQINSPGSDHFSAVLLLAEVVGTHSFKALRDLCDKGSVVVHDDVFGTWNLLKTAESYSLAVRSDKGESLLIVAGRQVVTEERLEVLALITDQHFPDNEPLCRTVERIKTDGAVAVIPWGAGKWLGHRGKILTTFIDSNSAKGTFIGDNGGRPMLWGVPEHFKQAQRRNLLVLPGSDPLPLANGIERVGSFGFRMSGRLSDHKPATELKKRLFSSQADVVPYGSLRPSFLFLKDQISLRLK